MFDHTHEFEIELALGTVEVSTFCGEASLIYDTGSQFEVAGIELFGNKKGDMRDKRSVIINSRSDDPFDVLLFNKLSDQIQQDADVQEAFEIAMEDYGREAA